MMTAMIELRSFARVPSTPMAIAAMREPTRDPPTTLTPRSSAAAAPANDSSLTPCTAKARSRVMTKTPMRPPTTPSTAPAMMLFRSSATSAP